jgi:hypothetical protein
MWSIFEKNCFAPKKSMKNFETSITFEPHNQNMSACAFWKGILV